MAQNMLPTETQILIVGAGPTGLAAAISLICNGVEPYNITIVDCLEKGANTSRAIGIHAATLEALDTYGCASRLVNLGIKGQAWRVASRSSTIFQANFESNSPYTEYPFVLILEQTATEHVLEERLEELGVEVKRPWRVVGMKDSGDCRGMDVTFESGETVRTKYVIGADGARSAVRQLSGINFADPDGKSIDDSIDDRVAQMVLADVSISLSEEQSAVLASGVSITVSDSGMFVLIPLGKPSVSELLYNSSEAVYRVGFSVPRALGEPPSKPSLEYIQSNLDRQAPFALCSDPKLNPDPVRITKVYWSTRFRTHSALADVFFKRVHGGDIYGMNLGLRDAAGLGPILAEHSIRTRERQKLHASDGRDADPEVDTTALEIYAASRRKRGLDTIRLTKNFLSVINFVLKPRLLNWPLWIMTFFSHISMIKSRLVYRLSGLGNR